jgi:hypothetical protein
MIQIKFVTPISPSNPSRGYTPLPDQLVCAIITDNSGTQFLLDSATVGSAILQRLHELKQDGESEFYQI